MSDFAMHPQNISIMFPSFDYFFLCHDDNSDNPTDQLSNNATLIGFLFAGGILDILLKAYFPKISYAQSMDISKPASISLSCASLQEFKIPLSYSKIIY